MFIETRGASDGHPVVFAHGWARDHRDFIPVAELMGDAARMILLDLPGFGQSPNPGAPWDTLDYAKAVRGFLAKELGLTRYIWVGHSFGARVGLRLAAMADSPIEKLFVVAGAGVKTPPGPSAMLRGKWRGWKFRRLKAQAKTEAEILELEKAYGSPDYVHSRELGLREVFIKAVQEDQSEALPRIACPTSLIYGARDTETPPAVGRLMHQLIPGSTYLECPEFDHLTILSRGRHQLTLMLREAVAEAEAAA